MFASELTTKELLAAAAIAISAVTGWIWMALLLWRGSMRLLAHTNWGHTAILACNEFLHRLFPPPEREWPQGRCALCGVERTAAYGHDPCIANLPGVEFACCGHGIEPGYVKFIDGRVIRGHFEARRDFDDPFPADVHAAAYRAQ